MTARVLLPLLAVASASLFAAAPPAPTLPWPGRLQIADRAFVDGAGQPVLPLCAHFAEAFSAFVRRPAEVEAQLGAIKDAGYDCIRFWDNLGEYSQAWRGKEVTPFSWTNAEGVRVEATLDYYGKLRAFLELVARLGLAVHHSRGDLGRHRPAIPLEQVVEHSNRVAAIYDAVGWQVLALYEANNEDFQNGSFGPAGLLRIVEPIKQQGALVAGSAPASGEPSGIRDYSRGFSVRYFHSPRDGNPEDRLKRRFSMGYEPLDGAPYLGWDGEPIGPNDDPGPGVTINSTEISEEIALLHAMTLVGARAATTYMSQHGVFWNGPIHRQSGFHATPRLRHELRTFAPDVMRWTLYHGGRREAVLRSPDGYAGDPGATHGPARIDQAVSPDRRRVVAFVYGGKPPRRVQNHLGCPAEVTFLRAKEDEQIERTPVRLAAGESAAVEYRVGALVLGQCAG